MSGGGLSRDELQRLPAYRPIIDVHTHLFPEKMFRAIRRWFSQAGWHIQYPYETGEVVEMLQGWGVQEHWALTYAHKPGLAGELNRWMGDVQRKFQGVRGFATLHPEDPSPEEDLLRALDEYGLCGIKLHAEVQKLAVDDPRLDGAFELLQERGLPCVLHAGDAPYPFPPPNLRHELVANRLARQPELKAVIAHLGAHQTGAFLELMERFSGLHLEVSFTRFDGYPELPEVDTESLRPFAERILFGSDFPNITFSYANQVDAWLQTDWVRENPENFFRNNARRLLPPAAI